MTTTAMMRTTAAAVVAVALLAPLTACSRNDAPAADATGPVEATSIQDTPQDLLVGVLRLREQGKADQAARYFISRDAYRDWNDLKTLDEVDASALCTSSSADCDNAYSRKYLSGLACSEFTADELENQGVELKGPSVRADVDDNDSTCWFGVRQIGGKWWLID